VDKLLVKRKSYVTSRLCISLTTADLNSVTNWLFYWR